MNGKSPHMATMPLVLQGALLWQFAAACWSLIFCEVPAAAAKTMALKPSTSKPEGVMGKGTVSRAPT